jgi:hypothetical protein
MKRLTTVSIIFLATAATLTVFFIVDCTKHSIDRGYDPMAGRLIR